MTGYLIARSRGHGDDEGGDDEGGGDEGGGDEV